MPTYLVTYTLDAEFEYPDGEKPDPEALREAMYERVIDDFGESQTEDMFFVGVIAEPEEE